MTKSSPNLIVTGFMGTGKSSVARIIAGRLQRPLVDTDEVIKEQFGKTIEAIFQEEGEAKFRQAEAELCVSLSQQENLVIATGGGTLVPLKNLTSLSQNASVFCLTATPNTLRERLSRATQRPLAHQDSWIPLLEDRRHAYGRIFHQVKTDNLHKNDIADRVILLYHLDHQFLSSSIRVDSPAGPYPIVIQLGALSSSGDLLRWLQCESQRVVVISNPIVCKLHFPKFEHSLKSAGFDVTLLTMPDGESHKTLATTEKLYRDLLAHQVSRRDTVIALGGGVTGDVAGFAAATYLRGIPFIQIPTTLLAMVDSSVGGKTGVDLPEGKNLVGAFKQPRAVIIDPQVLQTLASAERNSGMAEVIKHAIIADPDLFAQLETGDDIHTDIIKRAVSVKVEIVREDPFEDDRRAVLNFGHTFGHSIELVSHYAIRHGEAVAIGMVAAANLSVSLGLCDSALPKRIRDLLKKWQLPTTLSGHSAENIYRAMTHDKKRVRDQLRLVVPKAIGHVDIVTLTSKDPVIAAIASILEI